MPRHLYSAALAGVLLALAACETHEVTRSTYGTPTGLQPIPTRVEDQTPPSTLKTVDSGSKFDPLGDLGRAIGNLFPKKKAAATNQSALQTRSADGSVNTLPPGYTGSSDYHSADGKAYKLDFKEGALTGIDSSNKAAGEQPSK